MLNLSRRAFGLLLSGLAFLALSQALAHESAAQMRLVWPMEGVPLQDWVIGNYVDVDTRPIARGDYRGGRITYDGHDALDIGLAHFRAMDEGVDVYAAAAGTVVTARDGAYDRWSTANPAPRGEGGNTVAIDHGNGITTLYGHLKKDSVAVKVGDVVPAGFMIGQVGSSGQSTGPHLHFTVRQNGRPIETFQSPEDWWEDPLPYTGDIAGVLDSGVASDWPTQAEVEYGVLHEAVIATGGAEWAFAVMWNYVYGIPQGSQVNIIFRRPDGEIFSDYAWTQEQAGGLGFWQHGVMLPGSLLGLWNAEFHVDGKVVSRKSLLLTTSIPEPTTWTFVVAAGVWLAAVGVRIRKLADES